MNLYLRMILYLMLFYNGESSDFINSWLFLRENNTNLVSFLNYPRYNIKNKMSLFLPFSFSINSMSFAHIQDIARHTSFSINSFIAHSTVLKTVLLFYMADPPNQISKRAWRKNDVFKWDLSTWLTLTQPWLYSKNNLQF